MPFEPLHYAHPSDQESLVHLKAVKWFETVSKQLLAEDLERDAYLLNLVDNIRMTSRDFPKPTAYVERACRILGVSPIPTLFLDHRSEPDIQSVGDKQRLIVISSSLFELLSDEELEAALAHEVAHLASGHCYYKLLAQNFRSLIELGSAIPGGNVAILGLKLPLYDWFRKADLTADRGAFLVTQRVEPILKMIGKLAGGSTKLAESIPVDSLISQAREIESITEQMKKGTLRDRASFTFTSLVFQGMIQPHPWPAFRALEILRFSESAEATSILGGAAPEKPRQDSSVVPLATAGVLQSLSQKAMDLGKNLWDRTK